MIFVECHHSGALMLSATTEDEAPRFAWILHIGRKRPAGNASLNSLVMTNKLQEIDGKFYSLTLAQSDQGDNTRQRQQGAFACICHAVAFVRGNLAAA